MTQNANLNAERDIEVIAKPQMSMSARPQTVSPAGMRVEAQTSAQIERKSESKDETQVEPSQLAGTQTLMRGLGVISAVSSGARTLKLISQQLGTTRSTTHRLVSCLLAERYLRLSDGAYFLGPRLVELGYQAREQIPLATLARVHLERLAALTGDTIHLAVRDDDAVFYIDKIAGRQGLEMRSRVGHRMPLSLTGVGKALLLDSPREEWERLFISAPSSAQAVGGIARTNSAARAPAIQHPRPDAKALIERMTQYALSGYAFDLEDNEPSIRCVAAPVRDASGTIAAAISVSSTVPYMSLERMATLTDVVIDCAMAISAELGFVRSVAGL